MSDPETVAYNHMVMWPDSMRTYLRSLFKKKGPRLDRTEESREVWATFAALPLIERLRHTSREPEWLNLRPRAISTLGPALWCLSLSSMRVWLKMGLVCKEWRSARVPYLEVWASRVHTYSLGLEVTWKGPAIGKTFSVEGLQVPIPRGVVAPIASSRPNGSGLYLRWHDGSVTAGEYLPGETYAQTVERLGTSFPKEWDIVAERVWLFLKGRLRT